MISKHFFNAKGLVHHHPIFQAKLMKSGCLFFGFHGGTLRVLLGVNFKKMSSWEFLCSHCSRNCLVSESLDDNFWPLTDPAPRTSRDLLVYKKTLTRRWFVIHLEMRAEGVKGSRAWFYDGKTSLARKIRRFCKSKSKNKFQSETKAWYERSELLVHGRILK